MANKLNLYKGTELVKSVDANQEGATEVLVEGLKSNTDFAKGDYKVSFSNDSGESNKVDVPSFKTLAILVSAIQVTNATENLEVGGTATISASVTPNNASDKTLVFVSNNEEVATVDGSGKITAVAEGSTKISVASNDGNASKEVTVNVTVPAPAEPKNVTVTPSEESVTISAE